MVLLLYDENPFERPRPPLVTWLLIVVKGFVLFLELGSMGMDVKGPMIDH